MNYRKKIYFIKKQHATKKKKKLLLTENHLKKTRSSVFFLEKSMKLVFLIKYLTNTDDNGGHIYYMVEILFARHLFLKVRV